MTIDKIYIPTYKRVGNQITFDNLPKKWQEKTVLVVHPDEIHEGYPTLKCPEQGNGIANVRKWIAEYAGKTRYGVLDDDLNYYYTASNKLIKPSNRKLDDEGFDEMFAAIDESMDKGYLHVACEVTWNIPVYEKDYYENTRITNNIFYDGSRLPIDDLDWTSIPLAEDYYVNLQLLTSGYKNKVLLRYRTSGSATNSEGGCSTYRTIEKHNESVLKLKEAFPNFVSLREKIQKNGPWKGKPKLAATIQWKKAYKSSQ